ncbi:MAG: ferrous iron transport protein A [Pirellulaceae bacterium]|nr:ferrous iron transport protein A [Pirellulaceae bacterium]
MPTLADIGVGKSAVVEEIVGDDAVAARIMEMGVTDGEVLKVVGMAPLGDPLEIEVCGYRLSLRKSEADRIAVRTAQESDVD